MEIPVLNRKGLKGWRKGREEWMLRNYYGRGEFLSATKIREGRKDSVDGIPDLTAGTRLYRPRPTTLRCRLIRAQAVAAREGRRGCADSYRQDLS